MYYQNYEDYMKSVLGNSYQNEYMNQNYNIPYMSNQSIPVNANVMEGASTKINNNMHNQTEVPTYNKDMNTTEKIEKIKKMYPEIFVLLMPMINKIIEENKNKEITESLIESMTMEIYNNIEDDMIGRKVLMQDNQKQSNNMVNTRTAVNNSRIITTQNSTTTNQRISSKTSSNIDVAKPEARERTLVNNNFTQCNKKIGNPVLKDLIKILIINKIIDNLMNKSKQSQMMNYNSNLNQNMTNQIPMQNVGYYPNNYFLPNMHQMNQPSPMMNNYNQIPQVNMVRNIPNMNYPFTNYFSTPYPEDECAN